MPQKTAETAQLVSLRAVDLGLRGVNASAVTLHDTVLRVSDHDIAVKISAAAFDQFGYDRSEIVFDIDVQAYAGALLGKRHTLPQHMHLTRIRGFVGQLGVLRLISEFAVGGAMPRSFEGAYALAQIADQTHPKDVLLDEAICDWLLTHRRGINAPLWTLNLTPPPEQDWSEAPRRIWYSETLEELPWRSTHYFGAADAQDTPPSHSGAFTYSTANGGVETARLHQLRPLNALFHWDAPLGPGFDPAPGLMSFSLPQVQRTMLEYDRFNLSNATLQVADPDCTAPSNEELLRLLAQMGVRLGVIPRQRSFFPSDSKSWFDRLSGYYHLSQETESLREDTQNLHTAMSARKAARLDRFNRLVTFFGPGFTSLSFISTITAVVQFYATPNPSLEQSHKLTILLGSFGLSGLALMWVLFALHTRKH